MSARPTHLVLLMGLIAMACSPDSGSDRDGVAGPSGPGGLGPSGLDGGGMGAEPEPSGIAAPVAPGELCASTDQAPPMLRRLTREQLEATLRRVFIDGLLDDWEGPTLGQDPVSRRGFTTAGGELAMGLQTTEALRDTAEEVAALVTGDARLARLLPCAATAADASCATQLVATYGPRLFRRPMTAEEASSYEDLYAQVAAASDAVTGMQWTLAAMMQSPHFVYRAELGVAEGNERVLSAHELAHALAYTFTGQPADSVLVGKAVTGQLDTPDARVAEARALLATIAGQDTLRRFFYQWLRYARVEDAVKNDVQDFERVREAMSTETARFIDEVVFVDEGGVSTLLTANYTHIGQELTSFYGYGSGTQSPGRVERPENWGAGLLAQGSLLAANAHVDSSSPTLRGLLVHEKLHCNVRPTPPPDVPAITPPEPGARTTRERYEVSHAADPFCNSCHRNFDPIGFAFEHFDNLGRYRADESGLPIDDSAEVFSIEAGSTVQLQGARALAEHLAGDPQVASCVSDMIGLYALGFEERFHCLSPPMRNGLLQEGLSFQEAFAQLAASPSLRVRSPD